MLGNTKYPDVCLAKSGQPGGSVPEPYRHEFGPPLNIQREPEFPQLPDDLQQLVLHLIAGHHGRARPHFPLEEEFDPERPQTEAERLAAEVPRPFARLQRRHGRWGLAYLESLLCTAD